MELTRPFTKQRAPRRFGNFLVNFAVNYIDTNCIVNVVVNYTG